MVLSEAERSGLPLGVWGFRPQGWGFRGFRGLGLSVFRDLGGSGFRGSGFGVQGALKEPVSEPLKELFGILRMEAL